MTTTTKTPFVATKLCCSLQTGTMLAEQPAPGGSVGFVVKKSNQTGNRYWAWQAELNTKKGRLNNEKEMASYIDN